MKQLLEKYLKIYVHESSRFLWIAAISFVIFYVTAIFRNYVDTAFLKRFGPDYIPSMLVINALLTFVVMAVVDRMSRRFKDHFLLAFCLGSYAAIVTALYFLVLAKISLAYPILYQLLYLLDSILLVYLWNIAGDLFDARQGKRIFPLITASQVLGTTLGSFSTRPLTMALGEDPVLLIFAFFSMATALYLARTGFTYLGESRPKIVSGRDAPRVISLTQVPRVMKDYPIIRYLIVTGLIPNILLPIFFYQFSEIANSTFHSEQSLISFLSMFRGTTTLITFVLLFFVGRMYSSMGLTNASIVQPLNFALLFGSLPAFFNIYVAAYGQFSTILIQRAIAGPVNKILYSVIPSDLQIWSRTFIRGTVLKVGMLSGSLSMIALKPLIQARSFSYLAFALAVCWLFETLKFRKHYTRILKQVIAEKEIDFAQIESVRPFDSGGAATELGSIEVDTRVQEYAQEPPKPIPKLDPQVALKLLDDENASTRAEAAASFAITKDMRAVRKLIGCLEDTDDDVRKAAMEALMGYGESILPFLEVSLVEARPRTKQGILEVIRLSGLQEFEIVPFLGKELAQAYGHLIALRHLETISDGLSVEMLKKHLTASNEENLSLIFYALWVYHADMRLMYKALRSETASIAIELVENSIQKELTAYLIPLIEDIPLDEKIEKGRKMFPLVRKETPERLITFLANAEDPITRMLALFTIAEKMPDQSFVPIIESRLQDKFPYVREIAEYALKRILNGDAIMPDIIEKINKLRNFTIFEGMGVRELHAIASVITVETFQPGDVMIKEGDENSSIYLLVAGKVTIYEKYGTPEERSKVTVGEGAFLGELSLFTRMSPNATCVAAETTNAYVLRHHQFEEIMKVYPQIGINLCKFFTMKLRQVAY
ncbi:MAG: cyclic nucleotide-binding domain-containing protein [Desulfomonile tiedjei]|uniref:Cyclic nucleotide-binding domain-containing protein n=1 Tax=Desulfomonile tiedjei TaxID=2358 RepID=A0A9D6V5T1_9BACT|nr:cyclic nucleotide-binding domain-containing protein [Desulfomonile tiedjei]